MINIYNSISNIIISILSAILSIIKTHPTFDLIIATFFIYSISDRHGQRYDLDNKILFDSYSKLSKVGDKFCHMSFRLLYISYELDQHKISNKLRGTILQIPMVISAYVCRIDSFHLSLMSSLRDNTRIIDKFRPGYKDIQKTLDSKFIKLHVLAGSIIKDFKQKQIVEINSSKKINAKASKQLKVVSRHLLLAYIQIEEIYKVICKYK